MLAKTKMEQIEKSFKDIIEAIDSIISFNFSNTCGIIIIWSMVNSNVEIVNGCDSEDPYFCAKIANLDNKDATFKTFQNYIVPYFINLGFECSEYNIFSQNGRKIAECIKIKWAKCG